MLSKPCTSLLFFLILTFLPSIRPISNLTHLHRPYPDPDAIVLHTRRRMEESMTRRSMQGAPAGCGTGNAIDDCWRCGDWTQARHQLADCAIGFGQRSSGGKGGVNYVVTTNDDDELENPKPGTLRYGAILDGPVWITFAGDMVITLKDELILNSFKTIDGRGAGVTITGKGCITIQYITNVIIENIHVEKCQPGGNVRIRSGPNKVELRGRSDGDAISISGSSNIWVDHCSLADSADGLIDATLGSTLVTISNNHFWNHNEVMLMGHSDDFDGDKVLQVSFLYNTFEPDLVQRMPRCRHGYFHIANNNYKGWEMYAIGGSAGPTIRSEGNRFTAPEDRNAKEVTKRVDTTGDEWKAWNWVSTDDLMVNGAFFTQSGDGQTLDADGRNSDGVRLLPVDHIDALTSGAGVLVSSTSNGGMTPVGPAGWGTGIGGFSPSPSFESGHASDSGRVIAGVLLAVIVAVVLGFFAHRRWKRQS